MDPLGALEKAKRLCSKCLKMGCHWAEWGDMSEETMYMFLRHQFSDLLEKAWGKYTEYTEPGAVPDADAPGGGRAARGRMQGGCEPGPVGVP